MRVLQVRSTIAIQRVVDVERVEENAFQQQNVMQVVTQDNDGQLHPMYIQCKVQSLTRPRAQRHRTVTDGTYRRPKTAFRPAEVVPFSDLVVFLRAERE